MALILIKHGLDNPAERVKLKVATESDKVVLIQNGIYFATLENITALTNGEVFVLRNDLEARGFCPDEFDNLNLIDYDGLIQLIEGEEKFIG